MDKFVADHPSEVPPGEVHSEQAQFMARQDAVKTKAAKADTQKEANARRGRETTTRGEAAFSDFTDVVEMGQDYLTEGDLVDIRAEAKPEILLYKKCIERRIEAGGAEADALIKRLRGKTVKPTSVKSAPTNEQDGSEQPAARKPATNVVLARVHAMFED